MDNEYKKRYRTELVYIKEELKDNWNIITFENIAPHRNQHGDKIVNVRLGRTKNYLKNLLQNSLKIDITDAVFLFNISTIYLKNNVQYITSLNITDCKTNKRIYAISGLNNIKWINKIV